MKMKMIYIVIMASLILLSGIVLSGCNRGKEDEANREPVQSIEEYAARKGIVLTEAAELTEDSEVNEELEGVTEETPQAEPNELTGNILIDAEIKTKVADVGTWAYVEIQKEELRGLSAEEFKEFAEQRVKNSGYRWFSVLCDDGTGIQFAGSIYTTATYGEMDADGCIAADLGYIWLNDGAYRYEEE